MSASRLYADDIDAGPGIARESCGIRVAHRFMPTHKMGRVWMFQPSEIEGYSRSEAVVTQSGDDEESE